MTIGAPKRAVTELMLTSVGAKAVRAMRSQNRQNTAPPQEAGGDDQDGSGGAEEALHQMGYGDAHKGDGAGEGRDAGGENA